MTTYRMYGISDDTDTCEICGKVELRRVVMLQALDADDNAEELIYAGTTCAARALAKSGTRTTALKIRDAASAAGRVWEQAREYVAEMDGITFGRYMIANSVAADNASMRSGYQRTALEIAREWYADTMAEVAVIKSGTLAGTQWEKRLPTL